MKENITTNIKVKVNTSTDAITDDRYFHMNG